MEKVMTAQEKKAKEHQEIISRYHKIQRQQNVSFGVIIALMIVIFLAAFIASGYVLISIGCSLVFAMFAFMGYLGFFLTEAPIAEGEYNYVMKQQGEQSC